MKKIFLLIAAGVITMSVMAQERLNRSIVFGTADQKHQEVPLTGSQTDAVRGMVRSNRTTSTGQNRWYEYLDYIDTNTNGAYDIFGLYLWNDTSSTDIYSNGLFYNTMVSIATILDPYFSGFNNVSYYDSTQGVFLSNWPTKSYEVDSLAIYGYFGFNTAKTSVVDTIAIGYTYGTGQPGSDIFNNYWDNASASVLFTDYAVPTGDSIWYHLVGYDSVHNTGSGTNFAKQIITVSSAGASTNTTAGWGDTLSNGIFYKKIGLTTPLSVPAGNMVGVTISFKSGDASFAFGDTVFTGDAGHYYKFNMFRPIVGYTTSSSSSSTAIFPTYPLPQNASTMPLSGTDFNEGLFKDLPNYFNGWENQYIPQWAWWQNNGANASTYQYPLVDVHVVCATCIDHTGVSNTVASANVIHAYPDPAVNELNISFSLSQSTSVSVILTDMIGQVVAVKNIAGTTNGTAKFNTAALPDGVYIYTVLADGGRTTGRVVVAH